MVLNVFILGKIVCRVFAVEIYDYLGVFFGEGYWQYYQHYLHLHQILTRLPHLPYYHRFGKSNHNQEIMANLGVAT